jgi:probable F420-dependent oxidoreductase
MKFGLSFANVATFTTPAGLTELAQGAEAAGFESLWTVEHVIYPDGYESTYPYDASGRMAMKAHTPLPDPLIWLSFVGACTEHLRLGTGVLILPERNPVVLAKELATLDHLAGGRVELGVGVGWLREEFAALGIPFERRGARTDEYIEAMRALWDADHAEYHGEFVDFAAVSANPKPPRGRVPIHVGGHSRAAAERAGRLGDGFAPGAGGRALAECLDIMRQSAADAGRDPTSIEVTAFDATGVLGADPAGAVQELEAHDVDRVVVPSILFRHDTRAALAAFAERVM